MYYSAHFYRVSTVDDANLSTTREYISVVEFREDTKTLFISITLPGLVIILESKDRDAGATSTGAVQFC
jgi:hypothetical protein